MAQIIAPQHPTRDELVAFASGRMDDTGIPVIETHLSGCEACRNYLKSIPPDDLETLLRNALIGSQHSPDEGSGNVPDLESWDVPSALQNHPRYRVSTPIGAGGMGTVYRAEHRLMRRFVALKVINPRLLTRHDAVSRFRREVEAVSRLNHLNIATAHDAEQIGNSLVLVTELIEGRNLSQVVLRDGALSVVRACDYTRQAATGLKHAHERGIVHRDIKPSNLMVTPQGTIKILDFGLAALGGPEAFDSAETVLGTRLEGSLTDYGQAFGTPDFVAPEQRRDARSVDARVDIFSLGCTLRYLLAGDARADLRGTGKIPPALAAVVERMTDPDPNARYSSAEEVMKVLLPFLQDRTTRRRWLVLAGVGMVSGIGILLQSGDRAGKTANAEMPSSFVRFTRTTDTVVLPGRVELFNAFTIETRVMLTSDTAKDWCVFNQWESGREDLYLGVSPGGISGCCYPVANVDARCLVTLNEWHHVAFVTDGIQARLYLDGKIVGAAAAKGQIGKGDGVPTIGAVWRPPEEPRGSFIGNLHWLRVSNSVQYSESFTPAIHNPKVDVTTLLCFPSEASHQASRPAVGFVGATAPEPNTQNQ